MNHDFVIKSNSVVLRAIRNDDWDQLYRWHNDSEVLYFTEGDLTTSRTLEEVQALYHGVCAKGICFMIEYGGLTVGDCWLQEMNLHRILRKFPSKEIYRIDLEIGEKSQWGRGIGTTTIRLLTEFGFVHQNADMIFAADVADYNIRSIRAFTRIGYQILRHASEPPLGTCDLVLDRDNFLQDHVLSN